MLLGWGRAASALHCNFGSMVQSGPHGGAIGAFSSNGKRECRRQRAPRHALAAFSSSAGWAAGRPAALSSHAGDDKAALRGFQPMAGPPAGQTAQPLSEGSGEHSQRAATKPKANVASACCARYHGEKWPCAAAWRRRACQSRGGSNNRPPAQPAGRIRAFCFIKLNGCKKQRGFARCVPFAGAALPGSVLFPACYFCRGRLPPCRFFFFTEKPKSPILRPSAKYSPCA